MIEQSTPVQRTVCGVTTVPRHPTGGQTREQLEARIRKLEAENAVLRGQLHRTGWGVEKVETTW